jgi:HK97 family phage prohead protease
MKDIMILPFEVKSIKDDNQDYYIIEGYASVYNNVDLGNDRVMPGAFTKDLKERGAERPCLWQHDSKQPIGVQTLTETLKGLMFSARLPKNDDFVNNRVIPQLKCGSVKGASIGYETIKCDYNASLKCRDLKELKLYENSFVTFSMNPDAQILSVKNAVNNIEYKSSKNELVKLYDSLEIKTFKDYLLMDDRTEWDKGKAISQIKKHTKSIDKPSDEYKECFMWYDKNNSDDFNSYKMPYVYFDDNEFKAVPKAIYSIAGMLAGKKSGIEIPNEEKEVIKNYVNGIFKKLGKEMPFKDDMSYIDKDVFKSLEHRDLEKIFDDDIILSENVKKYMATNYQKMAVKEDEIKNEEEQKALQELFNSLKQANEKI